MTLNRSALALRSVALTAVGLGVLLGLFTSHFSGSKFGEEWGLPPPELVWGGCAILLAAGTCLYALLPMGRWAFSLIALFLMAFPLYALTSGVAGSASAAPLTLLALIGGPALAWILLGEAGTTLFEWGTEPCETMSGMKAASIACVASLAIMLFILMFPWPLTPRIH